MSTLSLLLLLQSTLVADLATVHPLDREVVTRAMRGALAENMNLEIVEISQFPVPDGEIAFDWKDLTPPAAGQSTARWRGVVRRDADHPFSIWAVVRVTAPCERVIAAQTIRPDEPIKASQLREESYQGFPSESCAVGIDGVIGKVATLTLSANTPIVRAMLAPPAAILKGDQAIAEYRSDGVWLSLPVIAQRSGRIGEVIPVQNPASHKTLLARVTSEGKVSIKEMQ